MKYFNKFQNFKLNEDITNAENAIRKALIDKKDFVQAYREILIATKKAIKKGILDDNLKETLKNTFIETINKYNVDSVDEFNKNIEKLVKDRNFISLKSDFTEENKIYLKYLTEYLKVPEITTPIEVKPIDIQKDIVEPTHTNTKNILNDLDDTSKKIFNNIVKEVKVPELNMNSKGEYVHFIQDYLSKNGYDIGTIDGIYGEKTQSGVKEYQTKNSIDSDGIVGSNTWNSILKSITPDTDFSALIIDKNKKIIPTKNISNNVTKFVAKQKITNLKSLFENINESINNLDGVEMTIITPYNHKTGWLKASFTLNGKPLYFGTQTDGVSLHVDKNTGKFVKGTMDSLLKNLTDKVPVNKTSSNINDFTFKNSKGVDMNFSELVNAPNKWYQNKSTVVKLIKFNHNRKFILALNKLYLQKTQRSLIDLILSGYQYGADQPILDILITSIVEPKSDAKVINMAIEGAGTEENVLKLIIDKRANESDVYKNKIAFEYEKEYDESLIDALEGDIDDSELIKKIIPNYLGNI